MLVRTRVPARPARRRLWRAARVPRVVALAASVTAALGARRNAGLSRSPLPT